MKKNKQEVKNGWKAKLAFLSIFFVLSSIGVILSILCLAGLKNEFIALNNIPISLVIGVGWIGCFMYSIGFTIFERKGLVKFLLSVMICLVLSLLLFFVLQVTGFFYIFNNAELLQEYLKSAGPWMSITYILLQFLQVIILPIPGIVSTAAGVAIFGPFRTAIYSIIGIVTGSFVAFFIGRKWGNKAAAWLVGDSLLKKWQRILKGKDRLFLTIMFILPLFPDDILCFIAGLSTMEVGYFSWMIILTRIVSIFATCYSIDFIPINTWWGVLLWTALVIIMVGVMFLVYKYMENMCRWAKKWWKNLCERRARGK